MQDTINEIVPERPAPRFKTFAKQIGGVPRIHTIQLIPSFLSDGLKPAVFPKTGLHLGTLVKADGFMAFHPPVIPDMHFPSVNFIVEYTDGFLEPSDHVSVEEEAAHTETLCSLSLTYLGKNAKAICRTSYPQAANGDKFGFQIPSIHVLSGTSLALSLRVNLLSPRNPSAKWPVLVRGCWLEFPYQE